MYTILSLAPFFLLAAGAIALIRKSQLPLPPSPPGHPIFGHIFLIPRKYPWKTFAGWGKRWGGLIYLHVLSKPIVVINDLKVARDLLDKRGSIYSSRPRLVMFNEMMGWDRVVAFLPYGEKFKRQRKLMHRHFSSEAVARFRPLQSLELYTLLENLVESPENYSHHICRATAGALAVAAYGYRVTSDHDPYVTLVEKTNAMAVAFGAPGEAIVDFIPALRHIPSWFPGAAFKRHALETKKYGDRMLSMPYDFVKQSRAVGTALPSFASYLLDEYEARGPLTVEDEEDIKAVCGIIYTAGFETTKSTLHTFIFAMLQYPDVAKRAQAEIDQVIGPKRMPTLEDRARIRYIEAIMKECLRWCPPVPLGIPHALTENDEYNGMRIPAKSMVVPNIWQFMHDERHYAQPETFDPDRFLRKADNSFNDDDYNPLNVVFGFGRRICPGKFYAEQGIWLTIACVLAAFDIRPPSGADDREYKPKVAFTTGTGSQPEVFQCRIVPRSKQYVDLIKQTKSSGQAP